MAALSFSGRTAFARSLADDRESVRAVLSRLAPRADQVSVEAALSKRRYSASETSLADGGESGRRTPGLQSFPSSRPSTTALLH